MIRRARRDGREARGNEKREKREDETEQKLISDCRYWVIESSSLVPELFREVFSHPYISFFHLLVNVFLLYIYIYTDRPDYITLLACARG